MNYREFTVNTEVTLMDAMKVMYKSPKSTVFVEHNGKLEGVITDGDFRRWVLKGGNTNTSVSHVMNKNPVFVYEYNKYLTANVWLKKEIDCVPVIDKKRNIISAIFREDFICGEQKQINIPVVIMAGGKGQRLYPYTKVLPKPLIPIGDLTIIERIMNNFIKYGCSEFYITLNYKKNMIKAYFSDLDYHVKFIDEDDSNPLGTGGSLYYLKNKINETFFVSNCDILVNADYHSIYQFHKKNNHLITVIASLKNTIIPYGVIELNEDGSMKCTQEKPQYNHLINTGMYLLEPEFLEAIQKPEFIHITDIINKYLRSDKKIGVFPVSEEAWMDMGQIKEMENMIKEIEVRG